MMRWKEYFWRDFAFAGRIEGGDGGGTCFAEKVIHEAGFAGIGGPSADERVYTHK